MLSYMLPVEDKTPQRNLNLNLTLNGNGSIDTSDTSTADLINFELASVLKNNTEKSHSNNASSNGGGVNGAGGGGGALKLDNNSEQFIVPNSILCTSNDDGKKVKMSKIGNTKNVTLKRVSFGSSKGSMVETLVFETPTPLPEHAEREFIFSPPIDNHNANTNLYSNNCCLDDSGIELQEELERSKVRVSFFQSGKPQHISPPDSCVGFFDTDNLLSDHHIIDLDNSNSTMTAPTNQSAYDRQISTESGWDNPFRPGGDLSKEADEIVNMIKGGKPITPTGDIEQTVLNGATHTIENGTAVVDGAVKSEATQLQATQNGTKSPQKPLNDKKNNDSAAPQTQILNQVIPGPQSANHVVIEEKKKKKCTCCVIQ